MASNVPFNEVISEKIRVEIHQTNQMIKQSTIVHCLMQAPDTRLHVVFNTHLRLAHKSVDLFQWFALFSNRLTRSLARLTYHLNWNKSFMRINLVST